MLFFQSSLVVYQGPTNTAWFSKPSPTAIKSMYVHLMAIVCFYHYWILYTFSQEAYMKKAVALKSKALIYFIIQLLQTSTISHQNVKAGDSVYDVS